MIQACNRVPATHGSGSSDRRYTARAKRAWGRFKLAAVSSFAFVEATGADAAIFSVGRRNRYRHPHPAVLQRWSEAGAQVWRSDRDGAIVVQVGARGVDISSQRTADKRYWQGR